MNRIVLFALAATAGLASAAPAHAANTCLTPRLVQSWNNLGTHAIVVRQVGGKRWRLELGGTCVGIKNAIALKVSSRGTGLCVDKGDYISYQYHGFGEQRCLISSIAPYTPGADDSDGGQESGDESQQQPSGY